MRKSLAQIGYEADADGGIQNFGPWENVTPLVRQVHENIARAVEEEIYARLSEQFARMWVWSIRDPEMKQSSPVNDGNCYRFSDRGDDV